MSLVPRLFASLLLVSAVFCASLARAATYHVSIQGSDTDSGSEVLPWRTIQRAVNQVVAGDDVIVHEGNYDERISTKRGGTSNAARIQFLASGTVVMRGWNVLHPFVTVRGFDVTGHTGVNNLDAHINIGAGGDSVLLESNVVRDGIYIVRTNIAFHHNFPNPDTIVCESGGFVAAGFKPGQSVFLGRGVRVLGPLNSGVTTLQSVTDTTLTVSTSLVEEPASPVYLSASFIYGLVVGTSAENCVIRSNVFRNLSFDSCFIGGLNNRFEHNVLEACHGWDAMHFMGTNNVFRYNLIKNSPLVVYQISPDTFENISSARFDNIVFDHNFVIGFSGVITSQKGNSGDAGPLTYSHNVFVDTGSIDIRYPNTSFINNTFVHVSVEGNAVAAPLKHPVTFEAFNSLNALVKNNLFVGCGSGRTPDVQGWYEFQGNADSATASHNFVSGPAPTYVKKSGFTEGVAELNGGDPGFANVNDPLGPDGVPFTDDDGLRLVQGSKLLGAGENGADIGAYNTPMTEPELERIASNPGTLSFQWPKEAVGYFLEYATTLDGEWTRLDRGALGTRASLTVTVPVNASAGFYRLAR